MRRPLYAWTVFLGALLLFQVQPLLGKRLLPWFGGSPATWTICMLFFELLLFGGYALADALIRRCPPRLQLGCELALLGAGLLALPIGPQPADRPPSLPHPAAQVLGLLLRRAALPYLVLAVTAPLLQHWYERSTRRSPYALYAFSNAGSLLGLLSYPLLVEPSLTLAGQARLWSWLFAGFALSMAVLGVNALRAAPVDAPPAVEQERVAGQRARWLGLSSVPCVMLLAVTNYITVDVAAVPFLWIAPLALYLGSFILVFAERRLYRRALVLPLWVGCTAALGVSLFEQGSAPLWQQLGVPLLSLFACCMLCHGELSALRPEPAQLSRFYLWVAAGGAAGGIFVGVLAPRLFSGFFELQLATIATYVLLLSVLFGEPEAARKRGELRLSWLGLGLGMPLIAATIWVQGQDRTRGGSVIEQRRSFYGVLRVTQLGDVTLLSHGRIRHGMQFRDPRRAGLPTLYFGPDSGAGRALRLHGIDHARRIGVVGLGVGTLACYGRAGDRMRFYELSPDVAEVARTRFSFLSRSLASIELVIGDGRISLEREPPQRFDLLVLDAFASDAVPTHLLTVEAFATYLRHLRSDGVLLANVSNRHLSVERVVAGAAARHGLTLRLLETPSDVEHGYARVRWALLSRNPAVLRPLLAGATPSPLRGNPVVWTDHFSNLLQVLR